MEKDYLLKQLALVKPAVVNNPLAPIFSHLAFENGTVTSHDDLCTIQVPCDIGLTGAIKLSNLEKALNIVGKTVEFSLGDKDNCHIKIGNKNEQNLPLLPKKQFVHEPLDKKPTTSIKLNKQFMEGIKLCRMAATKDISLPESMGVTVFVDDCVEMYSTDKHVLCSYTTEDIEYDGKEEFIIPTEFCDILLFLTAKFGPEGVLFIAEDRHMAEFPDDVATAATRLDKDNTEVLEYDKYVDEMIDRIKNDLKGFVPIPKDFVVEMPGYFEGIVSDSADLFVELVIDGTKLVVRAHNEYGFGGELDYKLRRKSGEGLIRCQPKHISRVLPHVDSMCLVDEETLVFKNKKGFYYFIAHRDPNKEEKDK